VTDHDHTKYAYHEGTRKLRAIADWISETTYTGAGPEPDGREEVYDMLIELHQLLYSVTLYPLHEDDDFNDEVYDDGRPAGRPSAALVSPANHRPCQSRPPLTTTSVVKSPRSVAAVMSGVRGKPITPKNRISSTRPLGRQPR